MNLFRVPLSGHGVRLDGLEVPLPRATVRAAAAEGADAIVLGVRPEGFRVLSAEDDSGPALDLVVESVEDTGAAVFLHTSTRNRGHVVVRLPGRPTHGSGARLRVSVHGDAVHAFSAVTGERLPL
jgi:multiple sugar transport system ATP-binding protein